MKELTNHVSNNGQPQSHFTSKAWQLSAQL